MNIKYKRIEHERLEDAPFVGALICAVDCNINCAECFNQYLKNEPTIIKDSRDVINEILNNKFNKGIILAGLEWTLQPDEMRELIRLALNNSLEVMVYTGLTEEKFKKEFIDIYITKGIYIKFGNFQNNHKTSSRKQYGVNLATYNQKIIKN